MLDKFSFPELHAKIPKYSQFPSHFFLFLAGQLYNMMAAKLSSISTISLCSLVDTWHAAKKPSCCLFLLTSVFVHLFIIVWAHVVLKVYKICVLRSLSSQPCSIATCHRDFLDYVLPGKTRCSRTSVYPFY